MNLYEMNQVEINATATLYGQATANIALVTAGVFSLPAYGSATALLNLFVDADETPATLAAGSVPIALSATGATSDVDLGAGLVSVRLTTDGNEQLAIKGSGSTQISFSGLYDIPSSIPVPDEFRSAPSSREVPNYAVNRVIYVPIDYLITVKPPQRELRIENEGRAT